MVGEKRLVRIEEAGRTEAVAQLVDAPDGRDGEQDDGVESSARRRGRRGGRRRSPARAQAAGAASGSD